MTEAVRTLNRAASIARDSRDRLEETQAHRQLFQIHLDHGNFSAAAQAATAERGLAEAAKDSKREAASCIRLAVAVANSGDLVKSLALAEEACDLAQAAGDRRGKARALRIVSEIHRLDSNLDAALEAGEGRLKIARDLGDLQLEALAMQEVADLQRADGNLHEARHLAFESRELCRRSGDRHGFLIALGRYPSLTSENWGLNVVPSQGSSLDGPKELFFQGTATQV